MGLFTKPEPKPKLATVRGRAFHCLVCEYAWFWSREIKLNSTNAEFFNMGWANQSALGLICARCGYVHEFAGPKQPRLWTEKEGYPSGS